MGMTVRRKEVYYTHSPLEARVMPYHIEPHDSTKARCGQGEGIGGVKTLLWLP